MSVTTSTPAKPHTRWQRIRAALVTLNSAGPELCEMLAAKYGQARAAAERCGITDVYFSYIRRGHRSPSVALLERMAFEVEATCQP